MNKVLLYYGSEVNNTPIFNSSIKLEVWQHILDYVKKSGVLLYNSKKVFYYKLNNIDIIETINNNRTMYNLSNFKINIINNNFLKLDYIDNTVEYITPEFDYFNKQIHNLQVYNIDNIHVYFDEYLEDGNIHYNIYSMIQNDNDTGKFIDIINKLV
jgi:hypothetical protein